MLPTCPACKQSVLDDDATECPFCGANMKTGKGGKGSAAPSKPAAAKSPAPPAASAPPPASKSPAASTKSTPSRKSSLDEEDDPFGDTEDDDPFAAATREAEASKANAIAMSPKKTKTNVSELKCPMCETVGFVPDKSGGKDVKCCNPSCKVPIFMAPKNLAPPVQTTTVKALPAKKAGGPGIKPLYLAIAGGVALVAIVGAAVYFWPEPEAPKKPDFTHLAEEAKKKRQAEGLPPVDATGNNTETEVKTEGDQNSTVAADIDTLDVPNLLVLMHDLGQREILNNKKHCRLRTAIGYALSGDVEGMNREFKAFDEVDPTLPHFKIPGYLTWGWSQLAKGDKTGAAKTADDAVAATGYLGKGSRETQGAVIDLAAFLIANGKTDAAKKVLTENLRADDSTRLAVSLVLARHRRDFDLNYDLPGKNGNPAYAMAEAGVTLVLTTRELWVEAEQWASSVADVEAKTDCLTAWADAKLRHALTQKQSADPAAEGAAAKLPPGGQVQLLARLALTQAKAGNKAEAERLIAAAQTVLKTIPIPDAAPLSSFKEVLDWKSPPEPVTLRQATLGAAAIGLAQAELKKIEEGWQSTVSSLKFARGIAPSPNAVAALKNEADGLELEALRARIRKDLDLPTRDAAERKTREMQGKLNEIEKRSAERFHLQEAVLLNALGRGMVKLVWDEVLGLAQISDVNDSEPYLSGILPAHLVAQFNQESMTADAAQVVEKVEGLELPMDEVFDLQQIVDDAIKNNRFNEAIDAFNARKLTGGEEEVALRGFLRQAKLDGQSLPALDLAEKLESRNNMFFKLEAIRMLAATAAREHGGNAVRTKVSGTRVFTSLEKIAGLLGALEGELSKPKTAPAAAKVPVEAAAKQPAK